MVRSTTFVVLMLMVFPFYGQDYGYHTSKKKAIAHYEEALQWSVRGDLVRTESLLRQALDKDDSFDEAIVLLHEVLLRSNRAQEAADWMIKNEKALTTSFANQLKIDQGYYFFSDGDYAEAKAWIIQVVVEQLNDDQKAGMEHLKSNIEFSLEQVKHGRNIIFETLPKPLNEWTQQYFPSVFGDEHLVFTVRDMTGRGDEDIYISYREATDWSKPKSISEDINSQYNEGTASISADGKTLVFTSCNRPNNIGSCDLYITYLENGQWQSPEILSENVNSVHWDSQPSLSSNGNVLFFVSKRPGGLGGQDIYRSELVNGDWQPAQNLGKPVNTVFDDASPVILNERATLIFASKGNRGMGGFDLFQSEWKEGQWQKPKHLGYPINNAYDQVGYSISKEGWAYFSSEQPDGRILLSRFKYPMELLPALVLPTDTVLRFINAQTNAPIFKDITLKRGADMRTEPGPDLTWDGEKSQEIIAYAAGFEQLKVTLPQVLSDTIALRLTPIPWQKPLFEDRIFFGFDQSDVSPKAQAKLDRMAEYIKQQNHVVYEIQGHTDGVGTDEYNDKLSKVRAEKVRDYLLKKNVPKENLVIRAYGKSRMLSKSYGSSGQARNRRVEVVMQRLLVK